MKGSDRIGNSRGAGSVHRIGISLPAGVFRELDQMVAEMMASSVLERRGSTVDPVMAGRISLVYDEARGSLAQEQMRSAPVVKRARSAGLRRNARTWSREL